MASKKQHEQFNRSIEKMVLKMGGRKTADILPMVVRNRYYEYRIETKCGMLCITTHDARKSSVFAVFTKFEDTERLAAFKDAPIGAGKSNGKWNYHSYSPEEILYDFEKELYKILTPVTA